ncbi:hypothetical protein ACMDCR_29935 [Labrys okinawensis]|uniref:hypothetical protein n=1 Tax=Labrys okinawensis TaxID=346911 RepID=UPI0039BD36D8
MIDDFRRDVALFLADAASTKRTVTYSELERRFGGIGRGRGKSLDIIAERLHFYGHPLLPVLVVSAETKLPSVDAEIYQQFGLTNDKAIIVEQERCFMHNWNAVFLLPPEEPRELVG